MCKKRSGKAKNPATNNNQIRLHKAYCAQLYITLSILD